LRDNEKLQTYFLGFMAVHSGLYWSLRDQSAEMQTQDLPVVATSGFGVEEPARFGGLLSDTLRQRTISSMPVVPSQRWFGIGTLVLSAVVLVAATIFFISGPRINSDESEGIPVAQNPPAKERTATAPVVADLPHAVARVDKLESQVLVQRGGAKQKATVGMEIFSTDSLDVPSGSSAELTLVDQSLAKLGPRTNFAFSSSREATLREGFIQIDARHRPRGKHLAITTPDATTEIQGAWMSMAANGKRTQIRVAEGSVLASRNTDGMAVEISEGYCSTIARAISPDPRRSENGLALFVVSAKALHAHQDWEKFDQVLVERIVGDRLWRSAIPVRMRTYDELEAGDLEDCSLVVLSIFPRNVGIEQKLIDLKLPELPTPVVCLEPIAFPVLGLTGPTQKIDFDFEKGPLVVDVVKPDHPLAAGFVGKGLELFAYRKSPYAWGKPTEDALTILRPHKRKDRALMFAYDQGVTMFKGIAPARRVGLFMIPIGADYNSPGLDLMDAAIDWCLEPSFESTTALLHPHRTTKKGHAASRPDLSQELSQTPSDALNSEAAAIPWNAESRGKET
jgi:hypothetical protein